MKDIGKEYSEIANNLYALEIDPNHEMNNNYGTKNDWNKKAVIQFSLDFKYICRYDSIKEASKKLNKNHSHIVQCCKKQRKTAYGYIWRYVKDE